MQKLYLIRHGETKSNSNGVFQGQTDSPLSQLGQKQAQLLALRLLKEQIKIDRLITSTLGRAIETAEYIAEALDCRIETDLGLQEINLGNWEGMKWEQIRDNFPIQSEDYHQKWWHFREHGGESWWEALNRFNSTVMKLIENSPQQTLMLVAHGGVIRLFITKLLGSNSPRPPLEISNTGITEIDIQETQLRILRINDHSHIRD